MPGKLRFVTSKFKKNSNDELSGSWRSWLKPPVIVSLLQLTVTIISVTYITFQLSVNNNNNKVAFRGQLYQTEYSNFNKAQIDDDLNAIRVYVPANVKLYEFSRKLLRVLTTDPLVLESKTAEELYNRIWGYDTMLDSVRLSNTKRLRKVFLSAQTIIYHMHNIFDYYQEGILSKEEWETWKGSIREMSAHPIFLAAIYQGYKYEYFSNKFAEFVHNEICLPVPLGKVDTADYMRDLEFINKFYPEMLDAKWYRSLPSYYDK